VIIFGMCIRAWSRHGAVRSIIFSKCLCNFAGLTITGVRVTANRSRKLLLLVPQMKIVFVALYQFSGIASIETIRLLETQQLE
jgi:hypothetical protein